MVTILKNFIEKYIDLIAAKDWRTLYSHAYEEVPLQVGNLTTNLMHAGINPLDDLDVVLPGMFSDSMIQNIELPVQISAIKGHAFMNCYELREITLPPSLIRIDNGAFLNCYELHTIRYSGTIKKLKMSFPNWEHFSKLFDDCATNLIYCTDGEVELL
jgi:hypothetical protein